MGGKEASDVRMTAVHHDEEEEFDSCDTLVHWVGHALSLCGGWDNLDNCCGILISKLQILPATSFSISLDFFCTSLVLPIPNRVKPFHLTLVTPLSIWNCKLDHNLKI